MNFEPAEMAIILEQVRQCTDKATKETVINLCEYGINCYQVFYIATNTGKMEGRLSIGRLDNFWDKIPTDGSPLIIMNADGANPTIVNRNAVVCMNATMTSVGSVTINSKLVNTNSGVFVDATLIIFCGGDSDYLYYIIEMRDEPADVDYSA